MSFIECVQLLNWILDPGWLPFPLKCLTSVALHDSVSNKNVLSAFLGGRWTLPFKRYCEQQKPNWVQTTQQIYILKKAIFLLALKVTYCTKSTCSCLFYINMCPLCVKRLWKFHEKIFSLFLSWSIFIKTCLKMSWSDFGHFMMS